MVQQIKRLSSTRQGRLIGAFGVCLIITFTLLQTERITSAKVTEITIRDISLEIRNMTFAENNPTINLYPGETVRFIIYNYDPGMKHDFLIRGTETRTRVLDYGETDSVLFKVPLTQVELIYLCTLHALKMRGVLLIDKNLKTISLSKL